MLARDPVNEDRHAGLWERQSAGYKVGGGQFLLHGSMMFSRRWEQVGIARSQHIDCHLCTTFSQDHLVSAKQNSHHAARISLISLIGQNILNHIEKDTRECGCYIDLFTHYFPISKCFPFPYLNLCRANSRNIPI